MNTQTAKILCEITNDFYRRQCASFSATRKSPWNGWKICLDVLEKDARISDRKELSAFDLACGNLRFEAFLKAALPETDFAFYAVDNCDDLVPQMPSVNYQSFDVLDVLQKELSINNRLNASVCDLSVSFGFMHHIPSKEYRENILSSLLEQTRSGGYVIVSFWQFLNNEALSEKAQVTHEHALKELDLPELDENDFLLGWKETSGAYRYCHSFSEAEIDQLVESVADKATVISRFVADGRTDNLNTYLVLQVH